MAGVHLTGKIVKVDEPFKMFRMLSLKIKSETGNRQFEVLIKKFVFS